MFSVKLVFFLGFVNVARLQGTGSGSNGNLRLCIVEGRGSYKIAPKYCPILDQEQSGVECVIGTDRLDCLRRISKGTVDFGVFNPEDLVAAQWANIDVLVTNEMRHRNRPYERSIVALVNRHILPDSVTSVHAVLRNTTLCHPGVAVDDIRPLSDTLGEYLESLVTEKTCDPDLSLAENRIKTLAGFFHSACKAGLWVQDKERDAELKQRYASLCAACGRGCAAGDRYWGDAGALACMHEGGGHVAWAVLDDVVTYFRVASNPEAFNKNFAFLCLDGSWQPVTDNPEPCVWINRPWPVIVAKRKASEAVSALSSSLTNTSVPVQRNWRGALSQLLQSNQALPEPLHPPRTPADYLARARGFTDAYSQTGCNPPRHITICTTSLLAKNKCEWLSEAGSVYGIAPPVQCSYRLDEKKCAESVQAGDADVTVADSDSLVAAVRDYQLTPVLYEVTPIVEKTSTVFAYVRKSSGITKMKDLRGKRAVFPRFDGLAWHAILRMLAESEQTSCNSIISDYFKEICAPGIEKGNYTNAAKDMLTKSCVTEGNEVLSGENQALQALLEDKSDVAFVSKNAYDRFLVTHIYDNPVEIVPICPDNNQKYCFITWSSIGHLLARKNLTTMRRQEIINVFTSLDQLFGKHYPFHTAMFSMYGPYNHQLNVLFHNNTRRLATKDDLMTHPFDRIPLNFENKFMNSIDSCQVEVNLGNSLAPPPILVVIVLYLVFTLNSIYSGF